MAFHPVLCAAPAKSLRARGPRTGPRVEAPSVCEEARGEVNGADARSTHGSEGHRHRVGRPHGRSGHLLVGLCLLLHDGWMRASPSLNSRPSRLTSLRSLDAGPPMSSQRPTKPHPGPGCRPKGGHGLVASMWKGDPGRRDGRGPARHQPRANPAARGTRPAPGSRERRRLRAGERCRTSTPSMSVTFGQGRAPTLGVGGYPAGIRACQYPGSRWSCQSAKTYTVSDCARYTTLYGNRTTRTARQPPGTASSSASSRPFPGNLLKPSSVRATALTNRSPR